VSLSIAFGIEVDDQERPKPGAEPRVDSVEISGDGVELLRMSRRLLAAKANDSGSVLRLDRIASEHAVFRQVLGAIVENQTTSEKMRPEDFGVAGEAIANLLPQLIVRVEQFFPSSVELPKTDSAELSPASMLFPVGRGDRKEDIAQAIRFFMPRMLNELIKGLTDALADELAQFQYLGPLRSFPPRHLAFSENEDANWYAGGGYAWDIVKRDGSVRQAVNNWLGAEKLKTRYRLEVRPYRALGVEELRKSLSLAFEEIEGWKESRDSETQSLQTDVDVLRSEIEELNEELSTNCRLEDMLKAAIEAGGDEQKKDELQSAMSQLRLKIKKLEVQIGEQNAELGKKEGEYDSRVGEDLNKARTEELLDELGLPTSEMYPDLILIDQRTGATVSHRDVGIGISQVLPVLVMAYGSRGKILAMEQPEIHLHPALQAELGDVFIEAALGERKNTFILETHSEHLILRLLRRIRETSDSELAEGLTPIRPEDIAVIYVQPGPRGSEAVELHVTTDGDFKNKWPDGFFAERAQELF
jgi:hypothetical protein